VFHAGLSSEYCGNGIDPSHADTLQQPHSRQIPRVCHGQDLRNRRMISVFRHANAQIANEPVGGAVRNAELDPLSLRKQRNAAHVRDELRSISIGQRRCSTSS
jgi:hypothetical protein